MTRKKISDWLLNAEDDFDYSSHEPLVNLSCVYENNFDEFEIVFAVPQNWLLEYLQLTSLSKLQHWLCNEYTSDDSREILENAVEQHKLAFWKIRR